MNYFASAVLPPPSNATAAWAVPCPASRFPGPCFYQLFDFVGLRRHPLHRLPPAAKARACLSTPLGSERTTRGCIWGLSWNAYHEFASRHWDDDHAGPAASTDPAFSLRPALPPPPPPPPPSLVTWCSLFVPRTGRGGAALGRREERRWLACVSGSALGLTFVIAKTRVPRPVVERHCMELRTATWPPSESLRAHAFALCVQ